MAWSDGAQFSILLIHQPLQNVMSFGLAYIKIRSIRFPHDQLELSQDQADRYPDETGRSILESYGC